MTRYEFTVVFEPDPEDGGYVAHVPALGIATQGETLDEARVMVQDAIAGFIESLKQAGQPIPVEPAALHSQIHLEQITVSV